MTCAENVLVGSRSGPTPLWGAQAARDARCCSTRVGLADGRPCPPAELTYIDQKRLELARALALSPDLLLLDEWLAGLNHGELQTASRWCARCAPTA